MATDDAFIAIVSRVTYRKSKMQFLKIKEYLIIKEPQIEINGTIIKRRYFSNQTKLRVEWYVRVLVSYTPSDSANIGTLPFGTKFTQ